MKMQKRIQYALRIALAAILFTNVAAQAESVRMEVTADSFSSAKVVEQVTAAVQGQISEGEMLVGVMLQEEILTVIIDISGSALQGQLLPEEILAARASAIGDAVLAYPELDEYWKMLLVDAGEAGNVGYIKRNIVENDGVRSFSTGARNLMPRDGNALDINPEKMYIRQLCDELTETYAAQRDAVDSRAWETFFDSFYEATEAVKQNADGAYLAALEDVQALAGLYADAIEGREDAGAILQMEEQMEEYLGQ